jgi:hypothetical protein
MLAFFVPKITDTSRVYFSIIILLNYSYINRIALSISYGGKS